MVNTHRLSSATNMNVPTSTSMLNSRSLFRLIIRPFPSSPFSNILRIQKTFYNLILRPDEVGRPRNLEDAPLVHHGNPRPNGQRAEEIVRHDHAGYLQLQ